MFKFFETKSGKKGYTLLFSVLTAALVLGVAAFILSISRKQFLLASAARESMHALYAADSGLECVADNQDLTFYIPEANRSVTCNGTTANQIFSSTPGTFEIAPGDVREAHFATPVRIRYENLADDDSPPACAVISVIAITNSDASLGYIVQSRGYNLCTEALEPASSPRIVERALQISYGIKI